MSRGIKWMLHERKMLQDANYTDRVWAERTRVKEAFYEGLAAATALGITLSFDEAWEISRARRNLYPGPPTPLHLAAKLRRHGYKMCDCRRPGGPGEGR